MGDTKDPRVIEFKNAFRLATRHAGFEKLVDIEAKTGLSHATISKAFNTSEAMPTEKTIYSIAQATGADPGEWTIRAAGVAAPPPSRGRRRGLAIAAAASVVVVVVGVVLGFRLLGSTAHETTFTITKHTRDVGRTTSIEGTFDGPESDELWLDVQSTTESRHHFSEQPCLRRKHSWSFAPLYVGRPQDHDVDFRINILSISKGSHAENVLRAYAARSKVGPTAYQGLAALPDGARLLGSTIVTRR